MATLRIFPSGNRTIQLTAVGANNNYLCVKDNPYDTTTYVQGGAPATAHKYDSYTWILDALLSGATINSVTIGVVSKLSSGANPAHVHPGLDINGVLYFDESILSGSSVAWTLATKTWISNPAGGAWDLTKIYPAVVSLGYFSTLTMTTQNYIEFDYTAGSSSKKSNLLPAIL